MRDEAVTIGIEENNFWSMTLGEIQRAAKGIVYRTKQEQKLQANYDYIQAGIIGRYVSVILSGKGKTPSIYECYPDLFKEEQEAERNRLNAERFRAFANSFNTKFNKEG